MQLNYRIIGKRIRLIRTQQHISQAALSEAIDKSTPFISYLENGIRYPRLDTLVDIANALKVTVDMFLADCLLYNENFDDREFAVLLSDCSGYERRVLVENARTLKRVLCENRHLICQKR